MVTSKPIAPVLDELKFLVVHIILEPVGRSSLWEEITCRLIYLFGAVRMLRVMHRMWR